MKLHSYGTSSGRWTRFRDTKGLIIDVRGNGGGSRAALRTLFPYFMDKKDAPHVANVAACRLRSGDSPTRTEGYLENRWLFPLSSSRWTDADQDAIRRFAKKFRPAWKLPKGEFSEWHYFVLGSERSKRCLLLRSSRRDSDGHSLL